jgi:hypothetical protein
MNWNYMVGDDRMRFCNQCNLNVYNISAMTARRTEEGFSRGGDGVLGADKPVWRLGDFRAAVEERGKG